MIVIVGGGICGLCIGWRLAEAGREVTVLERDEAGRAATWAAAGMLAARVEAEHGEEWQLPLLIESRNMWPGFAAELERASGIDVEYRDEGTIVVALDRDDREELEYRHTYLTGLGLELEMLTGHEARQREPHLARAVSGAFFSPLDHQVENRKVFEALKAAFLAAGGTLREGVEVTGIVSEAGRAVGVTTPEEEIAAEAVVLAAGAWSRNIAGLPAAVRPPVRPLKGQMLALRMPAGAALLRHVVWGPRIIYMVPRNDGRLIIGTTVEEMGFDTDITAGGMFHLLRYGWEILPAIYDLALDECWTGLRPTSRDDAPILGPTAMDGLVMATGHHRNGILLAPMTAKLISQFLLKGEIMDVMKPFMQDRFANAADSAPAPQAVAP